ncbi:hypothetical protein [Streptomyces sp. NPDC055210]
MTNKQSAVQAAANATAVATQAINDFGADSTEATGALTAAKVAVATARSHGASDDDIRAARPA